METNVTVGSLLSTSLAVFVKRILQLALVSLIVYLPQMAWTVWLTERPQDMALAFISLPLMILGGFLAQGAITVATYHDLRGQGFQLGAGLAAAMSRLLPLLGLSLATSVMVFLGSMLLIVPGIMLQCALFVAVPALMVERLGIGGAISRSFELTAGYRLKIFGLMILAILIVLVPIFVVTMILAFVLGENTLVFNLLNTFLSGIGGLITSVAAVVTYYRLREDVDGVGLEELDEVFA